MQVVSWGGGDFTISGSRAGPRCCLTSGLSTAWAFQLQKSYLYYLYRDYKPAMPDEDILRRLLALNRARTEQEDKP